MGGDRGAISIAVAVIIAVGGGAAVGVALDQGGAFGGDGETTVVALDAVNVTDCPAGAVLGQLHRGDRVFATGRDQDGDWIEIRDPAALANRIWIDAPYLVPDSDLARLPVHDCATTTTTPADAAPADPGATTTTTAGGSTGTTPGGGGSTPPPAPSDTTGPTITGAAAVFPAIWEASVPAPATCAGGQPTKSIVSAAASDPSGIASVTMSWSVEATSGSKAMTSSNGANFNTVLGTFPQTTIAGASAPISVTITARDSVGNSRTANLTVTLNNCTTGPS